MWEIKKNSKKALRMGRTERIAASVKAASPTAPHLIHACVKSNFSGSLQIDRSDELKSGGQYAYPEEAREIACIHRNKRQVLAEARWRTLS